jgi:hypothetical protein
MTPNCVGILTAARAKASKIAQHLKEIRQGRKEIVADKAEVHHCATSAGNFAKPPIRAEELKKEQA